MFFNFYSYATGGVNMRGDQKWPPQEYKQSQVDNDERRRIAQGAICRPRRVQKVNFNFNNNQYQY